MPTRQRFIDTQIAECRLTPNHPDPSLTPSPASGSDDSSSSFFRSCVNVPEFVPTAKPTSSSPPRTNRSFVRSKSATLPRRDSRSNQASVLLHTSKGTTPTLSDDSLSTVTSSSGSANSPEQHQPQRKVIRHRHRRRRRSMRVVTQTPRPPSNSPRAKAKTMGRMEHYAFPNEDLGLYPSFNESIWNPVTYGIGFRDWNWHLNKQELFGY